MSETVIPASNRTSHKHPGENQKYVGSRSGGKDEHAMTKNASIKHHNPEYFKRQSDRKNADAIVSGNVEHGRGMGQTGRDSEKSNENVGRGVGNIGMDKRKDMIPIRKDIPTQRDMNKHQKNVGRDPGRGEGQVGRDSVKKK